MKRNTLLLSAAAAAVAVAAGVAIAGPHHGFGERGGEFFRERFAEADTNKDGAVTKEEIEAARAARFKAADTDGDGKISRAEFDAEADRREKERRDAMFARLDDDKDGAVSLEEQSEFRHGERLMRADKDGDGKVTEAEMEAQMKRMMGRHGRHHRHGDDD
jgi:Ca2+-binding EF-hand superfamily protein